MNKEIKAVLFDLGGTLRIVHKDPEHIRAAEEKIAALCGTDMEPTAFHKLLDSRYDKYRDWALATAKEATEIELWTKWLVPELPLNRIVPAAPELTYQFRQAKGKRLLVEGGLEVIQGLDAAGYTLGIISNLIGTHEIQDWLRDDGLEHYFKTLQLSSVLCIRKPDPKIYQLAVEELGIPAENCAYIGDQLDRDILGAKAAGFGLTIAIMSKEELAKTTFSEENKADMVIHSFADLLKIFPAAPVVDPAVATLL
jgi:HAD superfamily hydrolase (TIGR01662 family)